MIELCNGATSPGGGSKPAGKPTVSTNAAGSFADRRQLAGRYCFLSDLSGWPGDLRCSSGVGIGKSRSGGSSWRAVRLLQLYDLRPHQSGDVAELDHATHTARRRLGNAARGDCGHSRLLADGKAGGLTAKLAV